MRQFIKSLILSAPLILALPTLANARGLKSTLSAPVTTAVKLEISLSEDLAYRANNLPEKLSDRGGSSAFGSSFSQNGHYGERGLTRLQERLAKSLTKRLVKNGFTISDTAPTVLRVTLEDVRNNRPTFDQLSEDPSLSYQSVGRGGADIDVDVLTSDGSSLGTMSYNWYEDDIRDSSFGGTWTDANRAIDRFAKRAAKELVKVSQS